MLYGLLVVLVASPSPDSRCLDSAAIVPRRERPPASVGQIIISGNLVTPHHLILDNFPLYPGQVLSLADLRAAERQLSSLRLLGIRSSVKILDPDGDCAVKDVLVTVHETRLTALIFRVYNAVLHFVDGEPGRSEVDAVAEPIL